jgi:hypothetical protein
LLVRESLLALEGLLVRESLLALEGLLVRESLLAPWMARWYWNPLTRLPESNVVSLTLAASQQTTLLAAGVAGAGVLVIARLLMRRLPPGMAEGLFIAALTGVACLGVMARFPSDWLAPTGHLLAALAPVWLIGSMAPARDAGRTRVRRAVFGHAGLLSGVAAAAIALSRVFAQNWVSEAVIGHYDGGAAGVLLDLALLMATAAIGAVYSKKAALWYGGAAAGIAMIGTAGAAEWVNRQQSWLAPVALLAAFAVGITLFVHGLAHWRVRSRHGLEEPERLSAPIGRPRARFAAAFAVSIIVGMLFTFMVRSPLAPLACAAAALSCFTVAHRRGPRAAGDAGMLLTLLTVTTIVTSWLSMGGGVAARPDQTILLAGAGVALGGLHALWLARFWRQQLHDGVAWTTAGRLIPTARRIAQAASVGSAILIGASLLLARPGFSWTALAAGLLVMLLALRLLRDTATHGPSEPSGAYCAWPAVAVAGLLLGRLTGIDGAGLVVLGLVCVLAALRYSDLPEDPRQIAHTAWLSAILPVGLLYLGMLQIESSPWAWLVAAGLLLLANAGLRRKRSAGPQATAEQAARFF